MQFVDIPYAMASAPFADWRAVVAAALAGGPVAALSFGAKPQNKASGSGHVAVIHVGGILHKNPSDFLRKFGATSTSDIHDEFEAAMQDPNTHAVMLRIDSPGGTVDGSHALAEHIYQSRNRGKQVHAFVDGMAGSAAYWVASAAHRVYGATPSTHVGSIGIISQHVDRSAALGAAGYKVTELTSGPYKNAGSPNAPLSGDHKAELQKHVDELHSQFAGNVARNRGMSPAAVAKVADGRVFLAGEAHKHGLIDGIKTFGEVLAGLTKRAATAEAPKPAARAPALDVAARARVYIEQQARLGRRVSAADAVAHISTLI
jgi:capsid assembly protease